MALTILPNRTTNHPWPGIVSTLRQPAERMLRRMYNIHDYDRLFVPTTGPVIFAPNHLGTLDGVLIIGVSPRKDTYALAKNELFEGPVGAALEASGQIPIARDYPDFGAMRRALGVLAQGHALAIFPEGARGAGTFETVKGGVTYLAATTGAPIVPVTFFGTRLPGASRKANPPLGSRLDVVYGHPIQLPKLAWPRTREALHPLHEHVTRVLREHVAESCRLTGLELPGPIPGV